MDKIGINMDDNDILTIYSQKIIDITDFLCYHILYTRQGEVSIWK